MKKEMWIGVAMCVFLSVAACIGSTGLGYADYRPLRNFDYFALGISWIFLIVTLIKDRRSDKS
ncbi:hypothetical protein AWV79_15915 [Cupriavidus sp. UYMMa02A]|nr:hypothetical protein AWV80_19825 [Cupriavidus sp. UYMU48A]ODV43577.1 hypothetical protein AWV79_15915 [Cupriavidus sp. UYMMa02A]